MDLGDLSDHTFLEGLVKKVLDRAANEEERKAIKAPVATFDPAKGGIGPPHGVMVIDDPIPIIDMSKGLTLGSDVVMSTGTYFPGIAEALRTGGPVLLDPTAYASRVAKPIIRKLAIGDDNEIDPEDFGMTIGKFICQFRDIFVANVETMATNTILRDPIAGDLLVWEKLRERFG